MELTIHIFHGILFFSVKYMDGDNTCPVGCSEKIARIGYSEVDFVVLVADPAETEAGCLSGLAGLSIVVKFRSYVWLFSMRINFQLSDTKV